jgi:Bacteriophage probable baseplate hub protein
MVSVARASLKEPLVPSFTVKLNDKPLANDIALWIVSATVEDTIDTPSMFTLQLISKEDERSTKAWMDDPRLALGAKVELSMGYGGNLVRLIVGDIIALEPSFSIGGPPTLVVRGYDRRNRLNGVIRYRPFQRGTDSAIAELVCKDLVHITATDSHVEHEDLVQHNQTDLDFLIKRATAIGYELVMDQDDGTTVLFRPMETGASAVATLTLNDDLLEFHPRLSLQPVRDVRVVGWDRKNKDAIIVSAASDSAPRMQGKPLGLEQAATAIFGAKVVETVARAVASVAEANALAEGRIFKAVLSDVTGTGTARGRSDIRAGAVITIDALSDVFNGNYRVEKAVHRYSPKAGYLTDFEVTRKAS